MSPLGRLEITLDADPETGQPAVQIAIRLLDTEGTVACVWYDLTQMRTVAEQVTQALAELEETIEQERNHGTQSTRLG